MFTHPVKKNPVFISLGKVGIILLSQLLRLFKLHGFKNMITEKYILCQAVF